MIRAVGTKYYFRRAVPRAIQAILGRKEFSLALKTSSKILARERACLLYGRIGELFDKAKDAAPKPTKAELEALIALQEQIIKDHEDLRDVERAASEAKRKASEAQHLYEKLAMARQIEEFFERMNPAMRGLVENLERLRVNLLVDTKVGEAEKQGLQNQIETLSSIIKSVSHIEEPETTIEAGTPTVSKGVKEATKAKKPTKKHGPTLTEMAERFVYQDESKSAGVIKDTGNTVSLFVEAFGDMPVEKVTGQIAGEFRDLLLGLPSNHGKGKASPPIREAVEQAAELELDTVSGKTVKNHFSRMSALWRHLVQRDYATRNPFEGWKFDITKKVERRAFSSAELQTILTSPWTGRATSERTYAGIVGVALYTGMRLGEICNLRNKDIEIIDGIPCFHVQPYTEIVDGAKRDWSPKTQAGERLIPIHSKLLEAGIMSFKNSGIYFFDELAIAPHGVRGNDFAQAFSKHKRRLGMKEEVSFHSFRHTVSTKLRNQEADIRELWIDAFLGHEATHRSQGTTSYMSGIEVKNLKRVADALSYDEGLGDLTW
ncbi:tyrosine-type recombinase/integrase [Acetobacter orientalis]|uniref:tyrosine-type recombinase/integrase n=1 Tax=Acetobacter orientalis TaxID=146474 RepID=UPI0039ECF48C